MEIRRFINEDAEQISKLVCRNFFGINIKDYPLSEMDGLKRMDQESHNGWKNTANGR